MLSAADSALAAELLTIAQQQLQAGTGVALDVTRARSQLAATRAQLIAARNESDRTRIALRRAVGLPFDAPVRLAATLDSIDAPAAEPMLDERDAARRLRTRDPRPPLVLRLFATVPGVARLVARRGVRALTVPPLDDRILHPRTGP